MWYFPERSFWRTVLLIVVLYLKLCKPEPNDEKDYKDGGNSPAAGKITPSGDKGNAKPGYAGNMGNDDDRPGKKAGGGKGQPGPGGQQQNRFTTASTTLRTYRRTTPMRISFAEHCDYIAYYCLKAYDTGTLCGRTLYYGYYTFRNYCFLDYVNCMERFEVWQIAHIGECFEIKLLTEYLLYPYDDDYFLDQYYIMEDHK